MIITDFVESSFVSRIFCLLKCCPGMFYVLEKPLKGFSVGLVVFFSSTPPL